MRQIKFRFWNKIDESFVKCDGWNANSDINEMFADMGKYNLIPMQYTGLQDKNGKDVFEGDVVYDEFNKKYGSVQMNGFGRWSIYWKDWDRMNNIHGEAFDSWLLPNVLSVIGNIYEHPNLLK